MFFFAMTSSLLSPLGLLLLLLSTSASSSNVDHGANLISWVRSQGGYVHPSVSIRRADVSDPTSHMGMFATGAIGENEKLLIIPRSCLIGQGKPLDGDVSPLMCDTVRNAAKEMRLGDASKYAPYVNYLLAQPRGALPSVWSPGGRKVLTALLDETVEGERLPPDAAFSWIEEDWLQDCEGGTDPLDTFAATLVIQRAWDDLLIPVYDMMSHRNPPYLNTKDLGVHIENKPVTVVATQRIPEGGEIYTSYNMCEDCGKRQENYGTPHILRDYGFVEQIPRRFIFADDTGFEIAERDGPGSDLIVNWIGEGEPHDDMVDFLHGMVEGLQSKGKTIMEEGHQDESIPSTEREMMGYYYNAMLDGARLAYQDATGTNRDVRNALNKLQNTDQLLELDQEPKDFNYNIRLCERHKFYSVDLEKNYIDTDNVKTSYQMINVMYNPTNKDTCFDLDNTVQQCTSYRPHYHEYIVHHTARYLPKIRRVLFVGGGDSMLLHEILKYPDLEKVVGLELDQQVTRLAFKHFGTRPHWHDPRVEWWYGDACKSLLLLPPHYFGSFDMVLVDLSETVMSRKVTDRLDMLQTLALLITPEGIMLKNELYFPKLSEIFVHTAQLHYYDVPVICAQNLVVGSHNTNFLQQPLTDHGVDSFLMPPLDPKDHTSILHTYQHTPNNLHQHCKTDQENGEEGDSTSQAGILMVMEVENAPALADLSHQTVAQTLLTTVKEKGLTALSVWSGEKTNNLEGEGSLAVLILQEGYVSARIFPTFRYMALDLHLWSAIERQQETLEALAEAVGGDPRGATSYRVVAGGMWGVPEPDDHGPRATHPCDATPAAPAATPTYPEILGATLANALRDRATTLLLCGKRETPCEGAAALEGVTDATVLWTCQYDDEDYVDDVEECEAEAMVVLQKLRQKLQAEETKLDAVVLDAAATSMMGKLLFKILSKVDMHVALVGDETLYVAAVPLGEDDRMPWQELLLAEMRLQMLVKEPTFLGQVTLAGAEDTGLRLSVLTKDSSFVTGFNATVADIALQTDLLPTIEKIKGGQYIHTPYEFSRIFKHADYDNVAALDQWGAQKPLEQQSLMQFDRLKNATKPLLESTVAEAFAAKIGALEGEVVGQTKVGEGVVYVGQWAFARAVLVWNGRDHMDLNIAVWAPKAEQVAQNFREGFLKEIGEDVMGATIMDVMPRGYEKVVNFLYDIEKEEELRWA